MKLAENPLRTLVGRAPPGGKPSCLAAPSGFKAILRGWPTTCSKTLIGMMDAPPLESPDRYAAHLLTTILGDHTGSSLYWNLVHPGHADAAEMGYQEFNQAGVFYTFVGQDHARAEARITSAASTEKPGQKRDSNRQGVSGRWS